MEGQYRSRQSIGSWTVLVLDGAGGAIKENVVSAEAAGGCQQSQRARFDRWWLAGLVGIVSSR